VKHIQTRAQFMVQAQEWGMRLDWHEPDEQGITARLEGVPMKFDNAGHWRKTPQGYREQELHVVFADQHVGDGQAVRGRDLAWVNLANLCAWASEPRC
jgi:hypothetical protein